MNKRELENHFKGSFRAMTWRIPAGLDYAMRAYCARRCLSLTDFLKRASEEYLEKNGVNPNEIYGIPTKVKRRTAAK